MTEQTLNRLYVFALADKEGRENPVPLKPRAPIITLGLQYNRGVRPASTGENEKQELIHVATRLQELSNTSNQVLIFLSFAIVAAVTYLTTALSPAQKAAVASSLRWWIGAIFPTV